MTQSDTEAPKDPATYRPRPLLGLGFWVFMAFGVLCVLAGAAVALLGPRLLTPRTGPEAVSTVAPETRPQPQGPGVLYPANAEPAPRPSEEIARLRARIAILESQGSRSTEAATAALAAAALMDAAQTSRPFAGELGELRGVAPELPELAALSRLATTGAPSRAALAAGFEEIAARVASRARKPPTDAGLWATISYTIGKVVTLRRVDDVEGEGTDALVARAELALREGDVLGALKLLDRLPPKGREALAVWREGAERRAAIDREVAALRARAVRDLDPGVATSSGAAL
ncbi:MAG: COG4223 family protein [Alphaproteobacteria bacterium]